MKIALINQKTGYVEKINREKYFDRVRRILENSGANIVIGPELAISNRQEILSLEHFNSFNEGFFPFMRDDQLLIPGTGLVRDSNKRELRNLAPIIRKNRISYVNKKTSVVEDKIAEVEGLEYKRGNSSEGVFDYDGRRIALEICRDHGHMKLKECGIRDIDLEFILACNLPGVSPEKTVVREGGIVALIDGFKPEINVYRKNFDNFSEIKGKQNKGYLLVSV